MEIFRVKQLWGADADPQRDLSPSKKPRSSHELTFDRPRANAGFRLTALLCCLLSIHAQVGGPGDDLTTRLTVVGLPYALFSSALTNRALVPTNGIITGPTNTLVKLEAVSSNGWAFKEWRGYTNGTNPVITLPLDRHREIGLVHVRTNGLATEISGHGQIDIDPFASYESTGIVQVSARPAPGYYFAAWLGDEAGLSPSFNRPAQNTMPLRAEFKPLAPGFNSLTLRIEGAGTFAPLSSYQFRPGENLKIQVLPAPGWTFSRWLSGASGSNTLVKLAPATNLVVVAETRRIERWHAPGMQPAVGVNGKPIALRFINARENLVALNTNGLTDWEVELDREYFNDPVVDQDGNIYTASPYRLWAVSDIGRVLWVRTLVENACCQQRPSMALSENGLYVGVMTYPPSQRVPVIRQYSSAGAVLNEFSMPSAVSPPGDLLINSLGVLYASGGGDVMSFTPDLKLLESKSLVPLGPVVSPDGTLYFGSLGSHSGNGVFTRLPPIGMGWAFPYSTHFYTALAPGNRVFIVDYAPRAVSMLEPNGIRAWRVLGNRLVSQNNPLFTAAADDGSLFTCAIIAPPADLSASEIVVTHFSKTGAQLWETSYPRTLAEAPMVLAPDGTLYVSGMAAIDTGSKPARSGWSMPNANWRNTRQALVSLPEPPLDTLRIDFNSPLVRLQYASAEPNGFILESSEDLLSWDPQQEFTSRLDLEIVPEDRHRFFRVVAAAQPLKKAGH